MKWALVFWGHFLPLRLGTDRRHVGSPVCSQTIPNAVLFISASRLKLLWFYPHLSCSGEQICKLMERCNKKKSPGRDDAICRQCSWIYSVIPEVLPDLYVAKTRRNGTKAGVQACVWVYWEKGMLSDITLLYGGCNWTLSARFSQWNVWHKNVSGWGRANRRVASEEDR